MSNHVFDKKNMNVLCTPDGTAALKCKMFKSKLFTPATTQTCNRSTGKLIYKKTSFSWILGRFWVELEYRGRVSRPVPRQGHS